jgi:hypothetical protein
LKKKRIAVFSEDDSNATFIRNMPKIADGSDAAPRVLVAPANSTLDKLFATGGYGAVIALAHASTIVKNKRYEQYAKHGGFTLNAIDESKAMNAYF